MSTTALFAEQLIIGLQGCLWIGLLISATVEPLTIPRWAGQLKDWATIVTIVALAMAYSLGIVLDRVFAGVAVLLRLRHLLRIKSIRSLASTSHDDDLIRVYEKTGMLTPTFNT